MTFKESEVFQKPATEDPRLSCNGDSCAKEVDGIVSFQTDLPEPLQNAMISFIEKYPNWDQYRLIQAALAGFLVQKGVNSRQITRLYVDNMFCSNFAGSTH